MNLLTTCHGGSTHFRYCLCRRWDKHSVILVCLQISVSRRKLHHFIEHLKKDKLFQRMFQFAICCSVDQIEQQLAEIMDITSRQMQEVPPTASSVSYQKVTLTLGRYTLVMWCIWMCWRWAALTCQYWFDTPALSIFISAHTTFGRCISLHMWLTLQESNAVSLNYPSDMIINCSWKWIGPIHTF